MSHEQNTTTVRRLYAEVLDQNDQALIDELCAPDMIVHDPFIGTVEGVGAYKQLVVMFQTAFPGHRTTVHQLVAEGDTVAALHTHYAHHAGDFMGLAPTGRDVVVEGIELYRLSAGRIVEFWRHDDDAGLLRQLGLVPEMA